MAKESRMSATDTAIGVGAIVYVLLWVAAIGGWIANIVKIFGGFDEPITAMFVARCVGVFAAPLGAVLGYL